MQARFPRMPFYVCCLIFATSCTLQNQTTQNSSTEKKVEVPREIVTYKEQDKMTSGLLDKAGNLWFGTSNEGVYRYDGTSFVNFTEKEGLSSNYVNCILEDKAGNLWFGTQNGLSKYDGKAFTRQAIPMDNEIDIEGKEWWNKSTVSCLLEDKKGNLWIGTGGDGAYRYNGESFTHFVFTNDYKQSDGLHHNFIQSMLEDTEGNIWFTSMTHGGVSRYDGEKTTHFSTSDGLKDDMVAGSFQDKAGNLWFGTIQTKFEGLYCYNGTSFTGFGKEDGLCDNFVTGFYEDVDHQLWIRTGSTLCIYNGKTFAPFMTKEGQGLKDISFIIEDKDGNIWLGGKYGHLWKYNGETLSDFTQKNGW